MVVLRVSVAKWMNLLRLPPFCFWTCFGLQKKHQLRDYRNKDMQPKFGKKHIFCCFFWLRSAYTWIYICVNTKLSNIHMIISNRNLLESTVSFPRVLEARDANISLRMWCFFFSSQNNPEKSPKDPAQMALKPSRNLSSGWFMQDSSFHNFDMFPVKIPAFLERLRSYTITMQCSKWKKSYQENMPKWIMDYRPLDTFNLDHGVFSKKTGFPRPRKPTWKAKRRAGGW